MKPKSTLGLVLSCGVLLCIAVVLWLNDNGPETQATAISTGRPAEAPEQVAPQPKTAGQDRQLIAAQVQILGECRARDGRPLGGASVRCQVLREPSGTERFHATNGALAVLKGVTSHTGHFSTVFPCMNDASLGLIIGAPGYADYKVLVPLDTSAIYDLGILVLDAGVRVTGRTQDEDGHALPGVAVYLIRDCRPLGQEIGVGILHDQSTLAFSNVHGQIECAAMMPAGTWSVKAIKQGYDFRDPVRIVIPNGQAEHAITVVMERAEEQPIAIGVIVNEAGEGLKNQPIVAYDGSRPVADARTASDGSFRLLSKGALGDYGTLVLGPQSEFKAPPMRFEWRATDLRYIVSRKAFVELRIWDGSTPYKAPVRVLANRLRLGGGKLGDYSRCHAEWQMERAIARIYCGEEPCVAWLQPVSREYEVSECVDFTCDTRVIDLVLQRCAPQVVRIEVRGSSTVVETAITQARAYVALVRPSRRFGQVAATILDLSDETMSEHSPEYAGLLLERLPLTALEQDVQLRTVVGATYGVVIIDDAKKIHASTMIRVSQGRERLTLGSREFVWH